MITVFTPTYNRAYIIKNLYASLLHQTNKNFEWIIVDDGSTDNTKEVIQSFIDERKIDIEYYYEKNGGKHAAINLGSQKAKGELFFNVDSDDYLTNDAIEVIEYYYSMIKNDERYFGIWGLRVYPDGRTIGGKVWYDELHCSMFDFRYKYKIKGDKADIYKTKIVQEFPYPIIAGENHVSEIITLNKMAAKYPLILFFAKPIYVCKYLPDGNTAHMLLNRRKSSNLTMMLYAEQSKYDLPLWVKFKSVINYWRFSFSNKNKFALKLSQVSLFYSLFALPISAIMYLLDSAKLKILGQK
ncbi:beta-glycosyltransferase [Spirochaetia bacterium]|nr:beta-glycosyltransferase [Spirochaetia bacterium]